MNKKMKQELNDVFFGASYERDELFATCDWFVESDATLFGCTCAGWCIRAEPDDILKNKWVIKQIFIQEV